MGVDCTVTCKASFGVRPMAETEQGKLWTTAELAKAAGVDGSTVRRALLSGKLSGTKLGNTWVISDQAARAWLEERQKRWH